MDANSKEKTYLTLLQIWKTEWKTQKLSHIPDATCFFADLKELSQDLTTQLNETTHSTLQRIYQKTLDNIDYMWRDFLDIREDKIRCAAHNQILLEESLLLPFEITFYHQLYTAYRGYSKARKMREDQMETKNLISSSPAEIPSPDQFPRLSSSSPSLPLVEEKSRLNEKRDDKQVNSSIENNIPTQIEETQVIISQNLEILNQHPKDLLRSTDITINKTQTPKEGEKYQEKALTFKTIRVLSLIASFVGADFKIYGPCQPEDILHVPQQNAVILIEEQYAKLLNI